MTEDIGIDERKHPRIPVGESFFTFDFKVIQGSVSNISEGGLLIKTNIPLGKGEELPLKLIITCNGIDATVQGKGRVAWIKNPDSHSGESGSIGITFTNLTDASKRLLGMLIEAVLGKK